MGAEYATVRSVYVNCLQAHCHEARNRYRIRYDVYAILRTETFSEYDLPVKSHGLCKATVHRSVEYLPLASSFDLVLVDFNLLFLLLFHVFYFFKVSLSHKYLLANQNHFQLYNLFQHNYLKTMLSHALLLVCCDGNCRMNIYILYDLKNFLGLSIDRF